MINAFIYEIEFVFGELSHAVEYGIKLIIQRYVKPDLKWLNSWRNMGEDDLHNRLETVYHAIDVKYEIFSESFRAACEEYEDDIKELFEILCDEDLIEDEDAWEIH